MPFDLETAIAVRERPDGLMEKDTFDLATAVPVETEISINRNARYSPPLSEEEKAQAVVELSYKEVGKKVPMGIKADWVLTSKPAKMITTNVLGGILTGGIIPFYNAAKGLADASSPNSDIGKMMFDSIYKGLAENEKVQNLGGAAAKAYPEAPWQLTGAMGALAEVMMFMPNVIKGGAELLSKDKQFTLALNQARQSPKWGDLVVEVSKKKNIPLEEVDQALYNKMWEIRGEINPFEVLGAQLKKATGIDLSKIPVGLSIKMVGPGDIGKTTSFTDPMGIIRSGIIKEIVKDGRVVIVSEGREIVTTVKNLMKPPKPKVEQPTEGKVIPDELKPLAEEARKYKSADEFVKGIIKAPKDRWDITQQDITKVAEIGLGRKIIGAKEILKDIKNPTEQQIIDANNKFYEERDSGLKGFYNKLSTPTGEGQKPAVVKEPSLQALETKPPEVPKEIQPQIPTPPETPIPPSEPPPKGSMPQEPDPVKQVIQALKEAKPIRAEQETLMKAERGKRIAKAKAMGEKISGEAGFRAQLGSLKGELPKAQFETLRGKLDQPTIDALFDKIRGSELNDWDKIGAQTGLGKLFGEFGGQVPTEGELKILNDVFGKEFTDALITHRTTLQKFLLGAEQVLNIPRTIMASFDLSAPLRQGAFLIGKPQQFGPAFVEMFKYFGSEKAFAGLNQEIAARPNFKLMKEHKLALTDLGTPLTTREEQFMSNWAEKIPLVGIGVRASGRAYTGFLNKLRADVFDDLYGKAKSLGIEETDKFLNDLTEFINAATGRGRLPGKLDKAAVALNSIFFSPRLMASRISLLNPQFYTSKEPFVRKEALKSLLTFAGAALTILGLAALGGAEVGTDWRSSDFLKIKIGNTRVDVWAGFQQYLRMTGQLITGQYVSSTTGKKMTLGEGYKPLTRYDIVLRQLENKEAPVASFITAILRQQTFMGEKVKITKEIATRFTPMVLGNFIELAQEDPKLLPLGIAGLFGVGVQSYKPRKSKKI